jgi:hypothetical protein
MGWTIEESEFEFWEVQEILFHSVKTGLRPTEPPIELVPTLSSRLKRAGREAVHLPSSSAGVKNAWNCFCFPIRHHGMVLN